MMKNLNWKNLIYLLLVVITLAHLSSCSTTNSAPIASRAYNDITSHYNAYFNAKEKYKAALKSLEESHKDNFKEVIPVYYYANPAEAAAVKGDLEDVEKRTVNSIQIHNKLNYTKKDTNLLVDVSNWVDDQFLLMAKSNFVLGNYDKSEQMLKYVTTQYKEGVDYVKEMKKAGKNPKPNHKVKKQKPKFEKKLDEKGNLVLVKIDERPKYSLFVHEPARAEALVWLVNNYAAQGKNSEAEAVVKYARSDDKFYKNLDKNLMLAEADNFVRQKNYSYAIEPLTKYLGMTKKKKERLRPLFILGQISEMNGNYKAAADFYKKSLKSRPNYDMEFYARFKRANMGRKGGGSSEEVRKQLIALSRDGKYKDYLDQIYYEIAELYRTDNVRADARKFYKKSVAFSTTNQDQKAQSYLRLAEMDFEEEAYVSAKFYYDSAKISLAQNDPQYAEVEARSKSLTKLVESLQTIRTEDSLQKLASMPKADRDRVIKKALATIEKEKEEKESGGKPANNGSFVNNASNSNPSNSGNDQTATFYFYNPVTRANGYTDFIKRWGRRKLEENWRRKNKSANLSDNSDTPTDTPKDYSAIANQGGTDEEKMYASLPMTPLKVEQSNDKIVEAYYTLGVTYKDDLKNYKKSTSAFEDLNKRFNKHKYSLESLYQLYLLANLNKNSAKADFYKARILAEYPESKFAKFINDPNYLASLKDKENSLEKYYESAYAAYNSKQFSDAEMKCKSADVEFKNNTMKPKFELLLAMVMSKQNRLDDYVQQLNLVINKYPSSVERETAQVLLSNLNGSKLPMTDLSKHPIIDTAVVNAIDSSKVNGSPSINTNAAKSNSKDTVSLPKVSDVKAKEDSIKATLIKKLFDDSVQTAQAKRAFDDSIAKTIKPYKPLTKAERLDSLMKAEKASKNKSTTVVTKKDTVTKQVLVVKDSLTKKQNTVINPAKKDSASAKKSTPVITKSDTIKKPTVVVAKKDSVIKKPVAQRVNTDSMMKARKAREDSLKSVLLKMLDKPAKKDSAKVEVKKDTVTKSLVKKDTLAKTIIKDGPRPDLDETDLSKLYTVNDSLVHYVVLYLKDPGVFNMEINTNITNVNNDLFKNQSLTSRALILDEANKLYLIKQFKNKAESINYINTVRKNNSYFGSLKPEQYFFGSITSENYSKLNFTKKLGNYISFYKKNYEKK